jgi:KipI family sensor histidine kinase inhibitor
VRLLPCGIGAVLAEYDTLDEVIAVSDALRESEVQGIGEVVPGARTVLVQYSGVDRATLERLLVPTPGRQRPVGPVVEIPVVYDGEDLEEVADSTEMTVAQVIELHSGTVYTAAFVGFTPGFAYLAGLPLALRLSRRSTPRTVVPAGSVAIASEFTGVYPTSSPGGWHLLGRTPVAMFDLRRPDPVLVAAGARVRFVQT